MSVIDPLFALACARCGRAYLTRIDEMVETGSACPVCAGETVLAERIPDEEDAADATRRVLCADAAEHGARIRAVATRLNTRSRNLLVTSAGLARDAQCLRQQARLARQAPASPGRRRTR